MKICIIYHTPVGGFKAFILNLVNLLKKRNCKITLLSIGNYDLQINDVENLKIDTKSIHRLLSINDQLFLFKLFTKRVFYKIISIVIKKNRTLQLQSRLLGAHYSAAKTALKCGTIVDLRSFDCVISSEELLCNYFLAVNVNTRKKIGYVHPDYLMAKFDSMADRYFFKKLDYICAVSNAGKDSLIKALPDLKNKIIGVPNPIDIDVINEKSQQSIDLIFDPSICNIITVCRLDNSSKALDRLLKIARELKSRNYDFIWRIIGDGPYKNEMINYINENHLSNTVLLLGYKENPLPFVKESDLFVLQSYYEGYPISVCESLILNTPVLITNFPSAKELVTNNQNSFIVNNSFEDILKKMMDLLNNQSLIFEAKIKLSSIDKKFFENLDGLINIISAN